MNMHEKARARKPGNSASTGKSAGSAGRETGQESGQNTGQDVGKVTGKVTVKGSGQGINCGTGQKAGQDSRKSIDQGAGRASARSAQHTGRQAVRKTSQETGSLEERGSMEPWSEEKIRLSKLITRMWLFFYAALVILGLLVLLIRPEISQGLGVILTGPTDIAVAIVISYFVHSGVEGNITQYFNSRARERSSLFDFNGNSRRRSSGTYRSVSAEADAELEDADELPLEEDYPEDPSEENG